MLNALFGVAYKLETPFFYRLAAPNLAPKTNSFELNPKRRVRLGRKDFEQPTS
jgi:hypothetical protein